ncbi:MAG TPA: DUF5615 family PIN-like protein [Pirellulales bacterium]
MTAIRLYLDEDTLHAALVLGLRARNIDVRTVIEAGLSGRDDATQLAVATQENRVLYSFNVGDFCRLHADYLQTGRTHAGIVVVSRQQYGVGEQLRRLLRWIDATPAEQMIGTLTFL